MKKRTYFIIVGFLILLTNWGMFKEISGINNGYYRYSNLTGTETRQEIFWQGRVLQKKYFLGAKRIYTGLESCFLKLFTLHIL